MDIDTLQGLRRCPLFNGLTESEIIDLMHTVRYRVVRCCKGGSYGVARANFMPSKALFANMPTSLSRARWWQA